MRTSLLLIFGLEAGFVRLALHRLPARSVTGGRQRRSLDSVLPASLRCLLQHLKGALLKNKRKLFSTLLVHSRAGFHPFAAACFSGRVLWWLRQRVSMARHHPDLIMCRKQPGIAIGRLCEKCKPLPSLSSPPVVLPVPQRRCLKSPDSSPAACRLTAASRHPAAASARLQATASA